MSAAHKRKAAHDLAKPKSVAAFRKWLMAGGAEVLDPTSQYELVRFRCSAGLSIVYCGKRGGVSAMTGLAREVWAAFLAGETYPYPPSESPPILTIAGLAEHPTALDLIAIGPDGVTIADVMRDRVCTMAVALHLLRQAEREGRLARTGGEPSTPYRWIAGPATLPTPAAPLPDTMEAGHG